MLLIVTAIGAHLPLLISHLVGLWQRPHFRFLPMLLPVCGYLLWSRCPRRSEVPFVAAPILESVLLGLSTSLLAAGVWLNSPFLGTASAILAVGYLTLTFAGARAIGPCMGAWTLLWGLIPPPLGYDLALVSRLQVWTSAHASQTLDLLGVDHLMSGNVLTMSDTTFFVDEACSGVHSLFALIGFTAVFIVLMSRGLRRGVLLLMATIPWSLFLNVLRIVAIAVGHSWFQIDLSTGWLHTLLGFVTFVIALALTLSTDQLIDSLGYGGWTVWMTFRRLTRLDRRRSRRSRISEPTPAHEWFAIQRAWQRPVIVRALSVVAICAYSSLGLTQVTGATSGVTGSSAWKVLREVNEASLPGSLGAMHREVFEIEERDFASDLGRSSRIWRYGNPRLQCVVSLDFPFDGWHELTRCYAGLGWKLQERVVESHAEEGWHVAVATFTNESGESAYLIYGFLNERGTMLSPPAEYGVKRFIDRVQRPSTVQVQLFCPSTGSLSASDHDELQACYRQVIRTIKPIVANHSESDGG